jgi:hypothetical protein
VIMRDGLRAPIVMLAGALIACQSPVPSAPVAARPYRDVAAAAMQAVAARDCGQAVPLLREAITGDLQSLTLHYNLAVCLTYLGSLEDAEREFRWVVANASAGAEEARMARDWLQQAGSTTAAADQTAAPESPKGNSRLSGQAMWADPGEKLAPFKLRLYLIGLPDTPTRGRFYQALPNADGRFEFNEIPAGAYKLTDRPGGRTLWRLRVTLPPAGEMTQNLGLENSVLSRDDFSDSSG